MFDEVTETLREIGHVIGMRPQKRVAAYAQVAEAVPIAGVGGNHAQPGQAQAVGGRQMPRLVEKFINLKQPKFPSRGDPKAALKWVEELEMALKVLGCNDEEKVTLAVYELHHSANNR